MKISTKLSLALLGCATAFSAAAFEAADVTELYLIGSAVATGWDQGQAPEMEEVEPGVFEVEANLNTGEFKFIIGRDTWDSVTSATDANVDVVLDQPMPAKCGNPDTKWDITVPGSYRLVMNMNDLTLTVSENKDAFIPTAVTLVYGETEVEVPSVYGSIFKTNVTFDEATDVTIKATDGKQTFWIKDNGNVDSIDFCNFDFVTAEEATSFNVVGTIIFIVDGIGNTLSYANYTQWTELYVVGSFNNWSFEPCELIADNTFQWVGDLNVADNNEIKFMGTNDWVNELGIHPYINNQPLTEANYYYLGGNDFKWEVTETGHYQITVNTLDQTVKAEIIGESGVEAVAVTNVAPVYYNLQGVRVANPSKGLYIKKTGDKAVKVCL